MVNDSLIQWQKCLYVQLRPTIFSEHFHFRNSLNKTKINILDFCIHFEIACGDDVFYSVNFTNSLDLFSDEFSFHSNSEF